MRMKTLLLPLMILLLGCHCVGGARHLFDQEIPLCDDDNSNKASLRNRNFSAGFPLANFSVQANTDGFRVLGENITDNNGSSSASGDINGDTIEDVLVGAANANGGMGDAYVIFGKEANQSNINTSSLSTDDGFRIRGTAPGGQLGSSLASGDINGDGIKDVIIGAPGVDFMGVNTNEGAGYVIFGKKEPTNIDISASLNSSMNGFLIQGRPNEQLGAASAVGDINADGIEDIILGALGADGNRGAGYVIFGSASPVDIDLDTISLEPSMSGFRIRGAAIGDQLGNAVSSGDINGDGVDDVIIGAARANGGSGAGYVIFGSASPMNVDLSAPLESSMNGFQIMGGARGDQLGSSLASGDINSDGVKDVLIGATGVDMNPGPMPVNDTNEGAGYVIFGSASPVNIDLSTSLQPSTSGFRIRGMSANERAGVSISSGDINGDNIQDALVGAIDTGGNGGGYVIFGKETGQSNINLASLGGQGFRISGANALDGAGSSIASGDINADGLGDVLVGAERAANGRGAGYVVLGACFP